MKQRVMIVGCGGIASAHIEGYLQFPETAEITVLADPMLERGASIKEKYGLAAKTVTDYSECLGEVDVVSICTPPSTHCAMAVAALEAGCHVLLEKPMAPSLAECDKILDAAKRNGKLVSVVAQSRFISNIRNAIAMVKSGEYGKSLYSRVNSVWYRGQSYYDLKWRGRWEIEGGGCTQNHSIHQIDLLLWAKGMPKELSAYMTNLNHTNSEEEDFSSSVLVYEDGSVAEITSSLVSHGEPQYLSFQMEQGGIGIPFQAYASKSRENGFPEPDEEQKRRMEDAFYALPRLPHENHDGQIGNFLGAVLGKEALVVTGEDGRRCMEVITGIYKSSLTRQTVQFPLQKEDPYYTEAWRKTAVHFNEKTKDIDAFADTTVTNFKGKF